MKKFFFLVIFLTVQEAQAQTPPDTTYAGGTITVLDSANNGVVNMNLQLTPIAIQDSTPTNVVYNRTTDVNGVANIDSVIFTLSYGIGMPEWFQENSKVFPNPSSGFNMWFGTEQSDNYKLEVFNIAGQQVRSKEFNGNSTYISLSDEAEGPYVYRLSTKQGEMVHAGKFINIHVPEPGQREPIIGPGKKSSNNGSFKTASTVATYQIEGNTDGHYPLDTIVDLTQSNTLVFTLEGWQTKTGTVIHDIRNKQTNQPIGNYPFSAKVIDMEDIIDSTEQNFITGASGALIATYKVEQDTNKIFQNPVVAKVLIEGEAYSTMTAADSISLNPSGKIYLPWKDTITIGEGGNGFVISEVPEEQYGQWVGKQKIGGGIYDYDQNGIANIEIVMKNLNTNSRDTVVTNALGEYMFANKQPSGDSLVFAVNTQDTATWFSFVGDVYIVKDVTLANPDSVQNELNWTLIPKNMKTFQGNDSIQGDADELKDINLRFNLPYSLTDTLNYGNDSLSYGAGWPAKKLEIETNLNLMKAWFGINFKEVNTGFNLQNYNPATTNPNQIGFIISNGNNVTSKASTQITDINGNPYSVSMGADTVFTSGTNPEFTKEIMIRVFGPDAVTLWTPSIGNPIPSLDINGTPAIKDLIYINAIRQIGINKFRELYSNGKSYHTFDLHTLKKNTNGF